MTIKGTEMNKRKDLLLAFKKSLAIMPGYIVVGIGFGVMMSDAGYSWIWCLAMCIFIFGGSMQYAAVGLLSGGASVLTTAIITLTIHARQFVYSLAMLDRYKGMGWVKPFLIFRLSDETFSIVSNESSLPAKVDRKTFYVGVTFFDEMWWIIGCVAGGLIGPIIPFDTTGVDFAMTALFIVIFIEQWRGNREHRPALTGLAVTFASLLMFGAEKFLIPALIVIISVLIALKKRIEKAEALKENRRTEN